MNFHWDFLCNYKLYRYSKKDDMMRFISTEIHKLYVIEESIIDFSKIKGTLDVCLSIKWDYYYNFLY